MPLGATEQLLEEKAANLSGLCHPKHSQSTELNKWVEHFHSLLLTSRPVPTCPLCLRGEGQAGHHGALRTAALFHMLTKTSPSPSTNSPHFPTASRHSAAAGKDHSFPVADISTSATQCLMSGWLRLDAWSLD